MCSIGKNYIYSLWQFIKWNADCRSLWGQYDGHKRDEVNVWCYVDSEISTMINAFPVFVEFILH